MASYFDLKRIVSEYLKNYVENHFKEHFKN